MKSTNAIEKAILNKIKIEIEESVDLFIQRLDYFNGVYGRKSRYSLKEFDVAITRHCREPETINSLEKEDVRRILHLMLKENYEQAMLRKKSKELIEKLDLV